MMFNYYRKLVNQYQTKDLNKTISICKEALNIVTNNKERYLFLYTISRALKLKQDYKQSILYAKRGLISLNLKPSQAIQNNEVWFAHVNWIIGQNYYSLNKMDLAIKYNLIAYNFFKATGDMELTYTILFNISLALKSIDSCLDTICKLENIIKNRVNNEDNYIDEITQYYIEIISISNNKEDIYKILNNITNKKIINELAKKGAIPLK